MLSSFLFTTTKSCKDKTKSSTTALTDLNVNKETNDFTDKKCQRRFSIFLSWTIILASLIQFSMFSSILGPYLSILEPGISDSYTPWSIVAYSFGQMVTPPLFGLWTNRIRRCRPPLSFGMIIMIISNLIFCYLDIFPLHTRKWMMLMLRVCVGLGAGIVSVARTYCATASTKKERKVAIAGSTAFLGLSVIAGPGAQAIFSLIGYPGVFVHNFHLHMYNAPAAVSVVLFGILLFLNSTLLLEEYPGIDKIDSLEKQAYDQRALPVYDRFGAWVLVWCWFCSWTALTNFVVLGVPFTQAQFDWDLSTAILYNGAIFGVFAAVSLLVYVMSAAISDKIQDRTLAISGMLLICCFYIFSFPWPFYSKPKALPEELMFAANYTVCQNFRSTTWCSDTPRVDPHLFLGSFIFLAVGFPIVNASLSSLLSKLLGPRKQGMMQGVYVTTGGFARLLGPLVISLVFRKYGPQMAWVFTLTVIGLGTLAGILFRHRLVPLNPNPILSSGSFYRYKTGVLYRL